MYFPYCPIWLQSYYFFLTYANKSKKIAPNCRLSLRASGMMLNREVILVGLN